MKTDFHNKDFAFSLALKWRLRRTRKWPIGLAVFSHLALALPWAKDRPRNQEVLFFIDNVTAYDDLSLRCRPLICGLDWNKFWLSLVARLMFNAYENCTALSFLKHSTSQSYPMFKCTPTHLFSKFKRIVAILINY